MGQKDMTEKLLEDYNDVFADIYNVLVFEKDVIDENRLRDGTTESVYKAEDGVYREQRRQVDEKRFPLLPVITLVLNMSDRRWNGCKSLADITKIPAEFEPFFQDYKVMVVDVAFLEDDVIERFQSDFKLVARFFKNRRLGVEPWEDEISIRHFSEFMDFLSVFTNDSNYKDVKEDLEIIKTKGVKDSMCYLAQGLLDRGADRMARLVSYLLTNDLADELQTVLSDRNAREEMYEKYGIEVAS